MWEEAVHAGLLHRWIKNKLGLPVLVRHGVVVLDGYRAKGLALRRQTIAENTIVRTIRDSEQTHPSQERSQNDSPEPGAGLVGGLVVFDRGHPTNYIRTRTGPETGALTILHKKLGSVRPTERQKGSGRNDKMHLKDRERSVSAAATFLGMCVSSAPSRVRSF